VAQRKPQARPTRPGPQQQGARLAERDDRDHRVEHGPAALGVAVPRDAVATGAVQAHAHRGEGLAELREVVVGEAAPCLGQKLVRQWLVRVVPPQQPRDVDLAVVHPHPLGAPVDLVQQCVEHDVGAAHPTRQVVDPRAVGQLVPGRASVESPERRLRCEVEHRGLVSDLRHGPTVPGLELLFEPRYRPLRSLSRRCRRCR
jgi:hypothetical protein